MCNAWRPKLTVFSCSSGSSTSAGAARWRATAAPSASRGTGLPTRSSVGSARGFWPWSRSQSDDLPSPSPGRGGGKGGWGASGLDLLESSGDEVQPGAEMLTRDNVAWRVEFRGKQNRLKTFATSQNWWISIACFSCGLLGKVIF